MVLITRRIRGKAAVEGVGRTTLTAVAAAIVSAVAGVGVSIAWPTTHKLLAMLVGVCAAAAAVIAFAGVAYFLDNGDLRVVVAKLAQTLRLRRLGDAAVPSGSPPTVARFSVLADFLRRRVGQALRMQTRKQVPVNSSDDQHDHGDKSRDAATMTRLERQCAVGIGLAAGIGGAVAVFTTSNQVGTAFLLLISLVFLVMGVEGTPLLRGLGTDGLKLRRGNRERQQTGTPTASTNGSDIAAATHGQDLSYEERVMAELTDERPRSLGPTSGRAMLRAVQAAHDDDRAASVM